MEKSYKAQDYFNEYLQLRLDIPGVVTNINFCSRHPKQKGMLTVHEENLQVLVNRMEYLLAQLAQSGVRLEDLILLSLGVDRNIFNREEKTK